MMLELRQQVEVETPNGRGRLFLVTDYGSEIEKIFTVVLYDGTMFEFPIDKIRLTKNVTMARLGPANLKGPFCRFGEHKFKEGNDICETCGEFVGERKIH